MSGRPFGGWHVFGRGASVGILRLEAEVVDAPNPAGPGDPNIVVGRGEGRCALDVASM